MDEFSVLPDHGFGPTEAADAKRYWASIETEGYAPRLAWNALMAQRAMDLEPRRVFEFGCNRGRNLQAVLDEAAGRGAAVFASGIDINESAVGFARAEGLSVAVGDETLLDTYPTDGFDVAFTVSVLDHVPDPGPILANLTRIAGRAVLLLEPWLGEEGRVETYTDASSGERLDATPYSYSWDYAGLARDYAPGWRLERERCELPTRLGRWYELFTLRPPD